MPAGCSVQGSPVVQPLRTRRQSRGLGFDPCSGKTPHALGQLSPFTANLSPRTLEPVLRQGSRSREKPALHSQRPACSRLSQRTPSGSSKAQRSQKKRRRSAGLLRGGRPWLWLSPRPGFAGLSNASDRNWASRVDTQSPVW